MCLSLKIATVTQSLSVIVHTERRPCEQFGLSTSLELMVWMFEEQAPAEFEGAPGHGAISREGRFLLCLEEKTVVSTPTGNWNICSRWWKANITEAVWVFVRARMRWANLCGFRWTVCKLTGPLVEMTLHVSSLIHRVNVSHRYNLSFCGKLMMYGWGSLWNPFGWGGELSSRLYFSQVGCVTSVPDYGSLEWSQLFSSNVKWHSHRGDLLSWRGEWYIGSWYLNSPRYLIF